MADADGANSFHSIQEWVDGGPDLSGEFLDTNSDEDLGDEPSNECDAADGARPTGAAADGAEQASANTAVASGDDGGSKHPSYLDLPTAKPLSAECQAAVDSLGVEFAAKFTDKTYDESYTYHTEQVETIEYTPEILQWLQAGKALFTFNCKQVSALTEEQRILAGICVNESSFKDETADNAAPFVDLWGDGPDSHLTLVLTSCSYIIPFIAVDTLTLDTFVTSQYHKSCQPPATRIWDDCHGRGDLQTFRITKPIIPWVFKMTIQFHCSEIPKERLEKFSCLMGGLRPDRAILMERTKRDKRHSDMTKKCKSVLLIHKLKGDDAGCLFVNASFIANSKIPQIMAPIIDRVGKIGTEEVTVTATRTRRYLMQTHRKNKEKAAAAAGEAGQDRASPAAESAAVQSPTSPSPVSPAGSPATSSASGSGGKVRRRIRPPGCTDETMYAFRAER